jgi:hypothetical protein
VGEHAAPSSFPGSVDRLPILEEEISGSQSSSGVRRRRPGPRYGDV